MKKQRLISRLVAGSMVLLLPVLSLCGCTQQQAPDQAQVSALIEQAEGIYHPNHPALTSEIGRASCRERVSSPV